jgi:hypothetical protein
MSIRLVTENKQWFNARVALTHPTKKLKPKYEPDGSRTGCFACGGIVHDRKTVHLDFDSNGNAFVSPSVYQLLLEAGLERFGLKAVNDVNDPPDQFVALAGAPIAITAEQRVAPRDVRSYLRVMKNRILRPSEIAEEE